MPSPPLRAAEQAFSPAASSIPVARRFVTTCLEQWEQDDAVWTVQLLLSELATNAVLHAGGHGFTVEVALLPDGAVRLAIADDSARPPLLRNYGTGATTGRGMALVADLARGWGVEPRPGGKVVWCEILPTAPRLRAVPDDESTQDDGPLDLDAFLGPDDTDVPRARGPLREQAAA